LIVHERKTCERKRKAEETNKKGTTKMKMTEKHFIPSDEKENLLQKNDL
jgi:hypothetical protein